MLIIKLALPSSKLNPNRAKGQHWAVTNKARKAARLEAFAETLKSGGSKMAFAATGDIKVTITFHLPKKRSIDTDNLLASMKPSIDGIALAIKIDDRRFNPILANRVNDGRSFVEVLVKSIPSGPAKPAPATPVTPVNHPAKPAAPAKQAKPATPAKPVPAKQTKPANPTNPTREITHELNQNNPKTDRG